MLIEHSSSCSNVENAIVENIKFLASDTSPYKGNPRAIDFTYNNSGLIDQTIIKSLRHVKSKEAWEDVIKELNKIPYPTLPIIESKFLNENNIHYIVGSYEIFEQYDGEDYSQYADYSFKKAIYYGKLGKLDKAREELRKALKLITSYTFRKDTTLSEIIEPLPTINRIDSEFAIQYAKNLKYLTDAVMKHTEDGKDTRWLTINWFEQLLNIDYKLASTYLVNQLLTNEYFWKLDYMYIDYLQKSHDVDPIILNFLYKLSPTNVRDNYLEGFLKVINKLVNIDEKLAKLSLINLSFRSWNDSYNSLSDTTEAKFHELMKRCALNSYFYTGNSKKDVTNHSINNQKLADILTKQICKEPSLSWKSRSELIDYYDMKDKLNDEDFDFLYFYLQENNQEQFVKELLLPIIKKRFPSGPEEQYSKTRTLIERLPLSTETKIALLIYNFVYSKDGWFSSFVEKESLITAIRLDRDNSLTILAKALREIFSASGFLYKYTANLIIALEHAGMSGEAILSMYKRSFDFIENRLPDRNDFSWDKIENSELLEMSSNELAIVFVLSKSKNLDAYVQKDIIVAVSYIMNHNESLLVKPFRWMFRNIEIFNQLFVASMLELLLVKIGKHSLLLESLEDEFRNALHIDNLYIYNTLQNILDDSNHG